MLNTFLRLDALASGALGLLLLVLTGPAEDELGMPVGFSIGAALVMLGWAGFVVWVAAHPSRGFVTEVVALNLVYVAASVLVAVTDWVALTDLGVVLVLAQALAVLGLTAGQFAGLREPVSA
jgi:hypothetical protein